MPANAFAAIRPIRRVQRIVGRGRVRRYPPYSYGRIMPAVPTVLVWANHAGECIRRYSPDTTCATDRRSGACPSAGGGSRVRRVRRSGACPSMPTVPVWANNAGEFIRRYSPNVCVGSSVGGTRRYSLDTTNRLWCTIIAFIQQVVALM